MVYLFLSGHNPNLTIVVQFPFPRLNKFRPLIDDKKRRPNGRLCARTVPFSLNWTNLDSLRSTKKAAPKPTKRGSHIDVREKVIIRKVNTLYETFKRGYSHIFHAIIISLLVILKVSSKATKKTPTQDA